MKKRSFLSLVLAGVLALSLAAPALAAPGDAIAVQLDGENLTFTDAVPQARDGRTFLPFRAVFEAMGAQVDYNAAANAVSATRGNKTVTMTLGSTQAAVRTGGFEAALTMDVAPFAENGRTYVPVRFAAQALGCAVGWDQDDQTVILVDTAKVLEEARAANQYTLLEQLAGLGNRYSQGTWALKGSMTGNASMSGVSLPCSAEFDGLIADGTRMELSMDMGVDASEIMAQAIDGMFLDTNLTAAQIKAMKAEVLAAYSDMGISADLRGDMAAGQLYLLMGGSLTTQAGIPADTWLSLDYNALLAQSGLDVGAMSGMDLTKSLDMAEGMAMAGMTAMELTDKDTAYASLRAGAAEAAGMLADHAFTKTGNDYTAVISAEEGGLTASLTLVLNTKNDKVVGYSIRLDGASAGQAPDGSAMDTSFVVTSALNDKDHAEAQVQFLIARGSDPSGDLSLDLSLTADYSPSSKAPQTTPPAGAQVLDFLALMAQAAAQA